MKTTIRICILVVFASSCLLASAQHKAVLIILDGISADALEKTSTPFLDEIASTGGYMRAYTGGIKNTYSQSPTVSAVGYNHVLTGTWSNKHNVWDNAIREPNYEYWNLFRLAEQHNPNLHTAIFSTWLDNRTKLLGEGLPQAGALDIDYSFDGFELDEEKFPHDPEKRYILAIDDYVSTEAARYIRDVGPDLSWVYLEYTDDVGHRYGHSPEYEDAIRKADAQVGRVWQAIQYRQQHADENWMIVVTTDHGRDSVSGKGHGGHSIRERTVWIVTNGKNLNPRFRNQPAAVDIMPTLARHLGLKIPERLACELDGVPFIGQASLANVQAVHSGTCITLTWDVINPEGRSDIFISTTDHFKTGRDDAWHRLARVKNSTGRVVLDVRKYPSDFYKICVQGKYNAGNVRIRPVRNTETR